MNRQNNLKIIITTVIVLIISAIAVFTVVNWAEIVKKFQGAAAKVDGFEKHERNAVLPSSNTRTTVSNIPPDEPKEKIAPKNESGLSENQPKNTIDPNLNPKFQDATNNNSKQNDSDTVRLEEPPLIKPNDSGVLSKFGDNDEYPMGNERKVERKDIYPTQKKALLSKSKKSNSSKQVSRKHVKKSRKPKARLVKTKNLAKRVRYLEKKLGVKNTKSKKGSSLDSRVYRLEKILLSKKK